MSKKKKKKTSWKHIYSWVGEGGDKATLVSFIGYGDIQADEAATSIISRHENEWWRVLDEVLVYS